MTQLKRAMAIAIWLVLASCTWVEIQPGAEIITLQTLAQVSACKRLGIATAQTKERVSFYHRNDAKVATELLSLARNEALALGGDTLVAMTEPDQGIQRFGVYHCGGQ